jgi:hypothetical protein
MGKTLALVVSSAALFRCAFNVVSSWFWDPPQLKPEASLSPRSFPFGSRFDEVHAEKTALRITRFKVMLKVTGDSFCTRLGCDAMIVGMERDSSDIPFT